MLFAAVVVMVMRHRTRWCLFSTISSASASSHLSIKWRHRTSPSSSAPCCSVHHHISTRTDDWRSTSTNRCNSSSISLTSGQTTAVSRSISSFSISEIICFGFYRAASNSRRGSAMWILSVRPSVRQTRELWQNARKISPDFYTVLKII